jgi:hypothetical protein
MTRSKPSEMEKLVKDAVEQSVRASLDEPIKELKGIIEDLKKQLEAEKATNKSQGEEISSLKLAINDLQQGKRLKYLRVFGINVTEDEMKERGPDEATCRKVYEKLLLPILKGAADKGRLPEVPTMRQTLSCGYRSGKEFVDTQGRTIPPPLVIKFVSKEVRDTVLRSKKEYIPSPSTAERTGGIKRYSLVEDLTRPTHQLFRELVADERVGAVWTIDGRIRFTKSGDESGRVFKVNTPFTTVEELLKRK